MTMTTEVSKRWWRSRTVWFNVAVAVFASLELSLGTLQPVLPAGWYAMAVIVVPLVNIALRRITTQPIA